MKALVVEDNPLVLQALARELGDDYDVTMAASSDEALALIDSGRFDLIAADFDLGAGATGDAVLAYARARRPATTCVLLLGAVKEGTSEPRTEDADLVLVKPITQGTLLEAVKRLAAGLPVPQARDLGARERSKRVLVVDDSPDVHELMHDLLDPDGFTVVSAYNGKEALELLLENATPGLLIIDLVMPEMNGMELIDILQSYRRLAKVPMMVVSAVKVPEPAQLPGVRYIEKPFEDAEMVEAVREMLHVSTV